MGNLSDPEDINPEVAATWPAVPAEPACAKHARYMGAHPPHVACERCWFLYFLRKGREWFGW